MAASKSGGQAEAPGVYVTLDELVRLRYRAKGFSFLPRQPIHSLLAGRHASRIRGRGLNFEELRGYLPGDDVRTIDWKVTARVGEPYIRVFTEERDRPAVLVVDQRVDMFYGSRVNMKSVTAAHLAAAAAWRITGQGDRVGAVVFNDSDIETVRPHRSQQTVMQIINAVVDKNRALRADTSLRQNSAMLNEVLGGVARRTTHDHLVVIISDFDGMDDETVRLVTRLSEKNDVLAAPVWDPSATEMPAGGQMIVSDGELQVQLDYDGGTTRKLIDFADKRLATVMRWQERLGVPVLPFSTDRDVLEQVRALLGRTTGLRRR